MNTVRKIFWFIFIVVLFVPGVAAHRSDRSPQTAPTVVASAGDVTEVNNNFNVPDNTTLIRGNAVGGTITITLPDAATVPNVSYKVVKIDSTTNTVVVDATGGDTIGGSADFTLDQQYETVIATSDGINYVSTVPMNDNVDIRLFNVKGDGVTDDRAAFAAAAVAANGGELVILPGTYKISSDISFDENIVMEHGALWSIDAGITVTFTGAFSAPEVKVFSGDGNVDFSSAQVIREPIPIWWGVNADDATDDMDDIADMISDLSNVNYFIMSPGAYAIDVDGALTIPVKMQPGAYFVIANGVTFTINAEIISEPGQFIFDTDAGGTIAYGANFNQPVDIVWYSSADPFGILDSSDAWLEAAADIGGSAASVQVIRFTEGFWLIDNDVDTDVAIQVLPGAFIDVEVGDTITLRGNVDIPVGWQIFDTEGNVVFYNSAVEQVEMAWFGGDPADDATIDQDAIQSAIDAAVDAGADAPMFVRVPPGTWNLDDDLDIEGVTLEAPAGAIFDIASGKFFFIGSGKLEAGLSQLFQGPGTVAFGETSIVDILPQWWGAVGDGVNDDSAAFIKCITSAAGREILFVGTDADYELSNDVTVPAGVTLKFQQGSLISVANTKTLTINGPIDAGMYQVFAGAGLVSFGVGVSDYVLPQWWGAVGDDSTDCSAAFNAAMLAAQTIGNVFVPSGIYRLSTPINEFGVGGLGAGASGPDIVGAGKQDSILKYMGTSGYAIEVDNNDNLESTDKPNAITIRDLRIEAPNINAITINPQTSLATLDGGGGIRISAASFVNLERLLFGNMTEGNTGATAIFQRQRIIEDEEDSMTHDTNRDFTTTGAGATEMYAIKFTSPAVTSKITAVTVRLDITGAPTGTVELAIYTDAAGSPNAQNGNDSESVTINTLSGVPEDVTFYWPQFSDAVYRTANRPSLTASTDYWVVVKTTGYTYTDTTTELILRVDAGDGAANSFGTFDTGGGGWSTSNDGTNNLIEVRYTGFNLDDIMDSVQIISTNPPEWGLRSLDGSQMYLVQCSINCARPVYMVGGQIFCTLTNFSGDADQRCVEVYGGLTNWTDSYIEGGGGSNPSLFTGGNQHIISGGNWASRIDYTDGTPIEFGIGRFHLVYSTVAGVTPWPEKVIYGANHPYWTLSNTVVVTEAGALNGEAIEFDSDSDHAFVVWDSSTTRLLRGTYRVTVVAKDANQIADDLKIYSRFQDGGVTVLDSEAYTLTAAYEPYILYHVVTSGQMAKDNTDFRISKNTVTANTIHVSHVLMEYLGPDIDFVDDMYGYNSDTSDGDGDRASSVKFLGRQSGGEQSLLAAITASHDGVADDQKGKLEISVNDGSDGFAPTLAIYWDSLGDTYITGDANVTGTVAATTVTGANVTSGADPGHTHTAASIALRLDQIDNMGANKTFNNGSNSVSFNFTNPSGGPTYDGAFEIQASAAFVGDLLHIHQHTGNPGVSDLLHLEAEDDDVLQLRVRHVGNDAIKELVRWQLDRSGTSDDDTIYHSFYFDQDGTVTSQGELEFGRFSMTALDVSEDTEDAEFTFDVMSGGVLTENFKITGTTVITAGNFASGPPSIHTLTLSGYTGAESKTGSITGVINSDPVITFIEVYISNDPTGDENIDFTLGFYRTDNFNVTDLIVEYTFNITYTETNGGVGDNDTTDVVDTTSGLTKGDWILWQEDTEYARLTAVPTATGIAFMEPADGAKADDTGLVRVTRIVGNFKYDDAGEEDKVHIRGTTLSAPNASMDVLVTIWLQ